VNPVDDALMRISHVLRGEDLLSSTPRQLALFEALKVIGVAEKTPLYGHLPYVMGEGNKKLSKRDPESSLALYRETGYLPEALLNYLALLGWSMGNDVEFFSPSQLADAFTLERVNPNPARFDPKKCLAINGDWIRFIPQDQLASLLIPFLSKAKLITVDPTKDELDRLAKVVPLIQERLDTLEAAPNLVAFLFKDSVEIDSSMWTEGAPEVLARSEEVLSHLQDWSAEKIQGSLRDALVEGMGLKPKLAFGSIRTAITGQKISPPLFESMEILGKSTSLNRLAMAAQSLQG
jgi:glutamyl-tRNA synthetase